MKKNKSSSALLIAIFLSLLIIIGIPGYNSYIQSSKSSTALNSLKSISLTEADFYLENNKYFLTKKGNHTNNININLFSGKKILDENSDYYYYIFSDNNSEFTACAHPSSIRKTNNLNIYCIDQNDQVTKTTTNKEKDILFRDSDKTLIRIQFIALIVILIMVTYGLVVFSTRLLLRPFNLKLWIKEVKSIKFQKNFIFWGLLLSVFIALFIIFSLLLNQHKMPKDNGLGKIEDIALLNSQIKLDSGINPLLSVDQSHAQKEKQIGLGERDIKYYSNETVTSLEIPPDLTKPSFTNPFDALHSFTNVQEDTISFSDKGSAIKEPSNPFNAILSSPSFSDKIEFESPPDISTKNKLNQEFNNQNPILNIIYILFIGIVFVLVITLIENYIPYREWLGFSSFHQSKSIRKSTVFLRWIVVTALIVLFFIILTKLVFLAISPGSLKLLSQYLLIIDDFLGISFFLKTYGISFDSTEKIKSIQYLFAIPAVFSLIAITIILHYKKKLLAYTAKLANGEDVETPKIRLQEFSQIIESIDTLQKRLKGKKYIETFINSIAHEIRTPLSGIKANTELLDLSMSRGAFTRSKNNIIESHNRMLLIVNSLLDLTKLEQQNKTLRKSKYNINNSIESVINEPDVVTKLKDKNIVISFNKHNENIISGNKVLIEMCLLNVINNAIDFSLEDGSIYIDTSSDKKNISVKVLDEGIGIPGNMLDKIQNKFVSTSRPYTNKRSTGLGLSLVKIIMELHNGTFEINNRKDVTGTSATLLFPV